MIIKRREYATDVVEYTLDVNEGYVVELEKYIKERYTFDKDFHLTVDDICKVYRNSGLNEGAPEGLKDIYAVSSIYYETDMRHLNITLSTLIYDVMWGDLSDGGEQIDYTIDDCEEWIEECGER